MMLLTARDYPSWVDENFPVDTLKNIILESSGGAVQRFVLARWLRNKDAAYLARMIRRFRPKDVVEQQRKIAQAQG